PFIETITKTWSRQKAIAINIIQDDLAKNTFKHVDHLTCYNTMLNEISDFARTRDLRHGYLFTDISDFWEQFDTK
ncbi:hypothetical protein J6590_107450, partial [Homalodisca vitripennis]